MLRCKLIGTFENQYVFRFSNVKYFICNVIAIQKEDKHFLRVFGNSEGDSGHEYSVHFLLSETER